MAPRFSFAVVKVKRSSLGTKQCSKYSDLPLQSIKGTGDYNTSRENHQEVYSIRSPFYQSIIVSTSLETDNIIAPCPFSP